MASRRWLGAALAPLMAAALTMTACTNGNSNPGGEAGGAANTPASAAKDDGTEQVTLKILYSGHGPQADTQKVFDEFNKRLGKYLPNTTVDITVVNSEQFEERLRLMLSAGEQVDVANLGSGSGNSKNDLAVEAKKGTLLALDNYLEQTPKLKAFIPQSVWDKSKVGGQTYMVASYGPISDKFIGLKFQKELTDKYFPNIAELEGTLVKDNGRLTQKTYDHLTSYLQTLKEKGEIRRGVSVETMKWLPERAYYSFYNYAFVAEKEDKNVKVLHYFEQPDVKMMYKTHADWYKAGYVEKDILSMQNRRQYEKKLDGNVLSMTTQYITSPKFPEIDSDLLDTASYGFPVKTVAWAKNYFESPSIPVGFVIPVTSKHPERAMKYLEAVNTNYELVELLTYGIEGEHFTRDSIGKPMPIHKSKEQARYSWPSGFAGSMLAPTDLNKDPYSDYVREFQNPEALPIPLKNFKLNITPIKNELAQYDAVRNEYELALYSGASDNWENTHTAMLDKMKKAGLPKIMEEIQKQVDAYLAENR
ncbi:MULTISPECIES: extracellular solute-binding protein [unclassified Paenibacillus]|uniref:extracellular solute-binding protein n=1 Tax=unclassified Paenibacillus TaxID=185978 RepID=UPI0015A3A7CE|nr:MULTISPECIES: extracellular solute-binding protein [unclassified Paenibacillus]